MAFTSVLRFLLTGPELTNEARLGGQWTSGTCLSLPSQCKALCLALCACWGASVPHVNVGDTTPTELSSQLWAFLKSDFTGKLKVESFPMLNLQVFVIIIMWKWPINHSFPPPHYSNHENTCIRTRWYHTVARKSTAEREYEKIHVLRF